MSAVLQRAKWLYRKVMIVEAIALLSITFIVFLVQSVSSSISFLLGGLASFIPQCVFIYWVFFRKSAGISQKMSTFYRGEGLKWLTTILLMILMLKGYSALNIVLFFSGYFVFLLCNSLLPILFKAQSQ